MASSTRLTTFGRAYVATVVSLGLLVIIWSAYQLSAEPIEYGWFVLAGLTLISGSATVQLPSVPASISISETFVITAVLLYGPAAGTVIVTLDGLVLSFWIAKRRREPYRALFNMSAPALSVWCSAHLFFLTAHIQPIVQQAGNAADTISVLPWLFLFAGSYFSLNSSLIAIAVSTETELSPFVVWKNNFAWLSLNYFCGASVAILLVITKQVDVRFIVATLPLLLVLYLTFKISMGRVQDADKHVEQVNRLYLSTIETLAMAVDAKDQITHGHIRRVQRYAVGLAQELGAKDGSLLKAIEAAALLHDMGKLAVPEHILNKPGKLNDIELEKMKLHASVGAEMLSAIDFPYPVVPIVRHHHECWDGSGYPDGIRGTDIPIGARILSVVDCFDALTSDRPYRPRLTDQEALAILEDRKGSMYDPLVVETFSRVYKQIEPSASEDVGKPAVVSPTPNSQDPLRAVGEQCESVEHRRTTTDDILVLLELAGALSPRAAPSDLAEVFLKHLRRIVGFDVAVIYAYDSGSDTLIGSYVSGEPDVFVGMRIPVGERLSGWVAATHQTIVNSDPVLDLRELRASISPPLRSCLSTPLFAGTELMGVLSLYSMDSNAFGLHHKRLIEAVGPQIGRTMGRALLAQAECLLIDPLTNLPSGHRLDGIVGLDDDLAGHLGLPVSILLVDVAQLTLFNTLYGHEAGDTILRRLAHLLRSNLRAADLLFRHDDDDFIVVLTKTDSEVATAIARRVTEAVDADVLHVSDQHPAHYSVTIGLATAPNDASTLTGLLARARCREVSGITEPRNSGTH